MAQKLPLSVHLWQDICSINNPYKQNECTSHSAFWLTPRSSAN